MAGDQVGPRATLRPRRSLNGVDEDRGEETGQFGLGLFTFGDRVGLRDDAGPGPRFELHTVHEYATKADPPFAVSVGVDPTQRSGVVAAVNLLEAADEFVGALARDAADRRRRMEQT